jgi:hypothetical protein
MRLKIKKKKPLLDRSVWVHVPGFFHHSQDELWNLIPPGCKSVYLCLGWSYPEPEKTLANL